jgi:hypothetical protein
MILAHIFTVIVILTVKKSFANTAHWVGYSPIIVLALRKPIHEICS